jgi:heptosyltransferase I
MLNLTTPPRSLCILRLSALGDTCHAAAIVRRLQRVWPDTRLTWVIGRLEARLMQLLPGVEFITVDKRAGWHSLRAVRAQLAGRRFDVLLHMQVSLRASVVSTLIRAPVRLGFDRARARELQWLFTNSQVPARRDQHVLDGFFGFLAALGIAPAAPEWNLPLPPQAQQYAADLLPDGRATLLISPCSSHALRNWSAERYAAVARHAVQTHGMRVILCGGPTAAERDMGAAIAHAAAPTPLVNQIGRDTLPQLLALLSRATVLLSPDAGPVHMATMVGTPVIGLYAATRCERSGPYLSRQWCVDRFEQAARRFRGRSASQLPWGAKIEVPGVMDLIETTDVCARLDALLRAPATIAAHAGHSGSHLTG